MLGIGDYLWRSVPANPILLRVVGLAGQRRRDLFIRCGYLGLLIVVVLFTLLGGSGATGSLTEMAVASGNVFRNMSFVQLALVAFLAPIFTAGAITQEQDSQTYDILLATPLNNAQIVLGSLLSRLFFVIALLISGIPIFAITQVFGGVAIRSIILSFFIAAATAFVTGAIAMAIATFKVGTRRTIFSFYLFIIIYLVGGYFLDSAEVLHPILNDGTRSGTSYLSAFHPFLALRGIFNDPQFAPPDIAELPASLHGWFTATILTRPQVFYVWFMMILSLLLVTPSIILLRQMAQTSVTPGVWLMRLLRIRRADRNRNPRTVWSNPIAWREARTRGSAARASLIRYGFIAIGLLSAAALLVGYASISETDKYITRTSYDAEASTLAITDSGQIVTYRITPETIITNAGETGTVDSLRSHRKVRYFTGPNSSLTTIELYDLDRRISLENLRAAIVAILFIELAVILLIVTNAAASTVTREKEDGTLDLLLATPITSRYYIWGKLRGLVSYVIPLLAVPVGTLLIFIVYDIIRRIGTGGIAEPWIVLPESVLLLPCVLIMSIAFAAIWGMQTSLRMRKTVTAVMVSVGSIVGMFAVFGLCGWSMLQSTNSEISVIIASLNPFTLLMLLVDPARYGPPRMITNNQIEFLRLVTAGSTLAATAALGLLVWWTYGSMVKNFDMTIRRQSR